MKKILLFMILFLGLATACEAKPFNESNWYVTVDIVQLNNKVMPLLVQFSSDKDNFEIKKIIPDTFHQITLYGNSGQENDLSAVITGDFSAFSVTDFITQEMHQVDGISVVTLNKIIKYKGIEVAKYIDLKDGKNKLFYSAKVNPNLVVVSFDKSEVYNWIDNKYDNNKLQTSGLISILLNIESSIINMGADLKSNSNPFNSIMFQHITQFSASVYESSSEGLTIESVVSTADDATTKQLEQIVNGLVAMSALTNLDEGNQFLTGLLSSLQINNHGNELLISTQLPYSLLSKADFD